MIYVIDNQPNPTITLSIIESGPWYILPTSNSYEEYKKRCIKSIYLPTCNTNPQSWLMSFSSNSFNPAAGMACYLQATCSDDQSIVTISAYSESSCTTSPRMIETAPADSSTITHLIRFGISLVANCESSTAMPNSNVESVKVNVVYHSFSAQCSPDATQMIC
jgi:hypothetical protein